MVTSARRHEIALAMGLAAVAGFVDAIGFIVAGGFFVSFMTGNTTRAAVNLADTDYGQVALAGSLVAGFVTGVISATMIGDRLSVDARRPLLLVLVAALLSVGAVLSVGAGAATVAGTAGWPLRIAMVVVAAAMGALNTVFERDGEVSIGVTYMTGTLVKFGQQVAARLQGRRTTLWRRYLALWGSLALGGAAGALGHHWLGTPVLWAAVVALLVTAAAVRPVAKRASRRVGSRDEPDETVRHRRVDRSEAPDEP